MAKLVKQIVDLIGLATDNGISQHFSFTQICDAIQGAQVTLQRELNNRIKNDKSARNLMLPFEVRNAAITVTAKIGSLPVDFLDEIEVYSTAGPIIIKEETNFRRRRRTTGDPIDTIADRVNTGKIFGDSGTKKIELEQQITPITMHYYRLPVKPVYVAPVTSGYPVYDDAASTDVEFSDAVHDILVMKTCEILGVPIDKISVQRFGAKEEPKIADY